MPVLTPAAALTVAMSLAVDAWLSGDSYCPYHGQGCHCPMACPAPDLLPTADALADAAEALMSPAALAGPDTADAPADAPVTPARQAGIRGMISAVDSLARRQADARAASDSDPFTAPTLFPADLTRGIRGVGAMGSLTVWSAALAGDSQVLVIWQADSGEQSAELYDRTDRVAVWSGSTLPVC